ncbi:MAG: ATP-binding protein [Desulfuromonadales bacterium]|nr:ATP-binding protein [Desulfuromonadales bacterium]NIS40366.1 ATP-binding protein [Desulfuromonadales bacterium]
MADRTAALALDLGTTTLGGCLVGPDGAILAESRLENPQVSLGSDVITRLEAARAGAAEELHRLLAAGIGQLTDDLLGQGGDKGCDVTGIAAAGNPAVCHLLLNLPADSILFPPHRPAETCGRLFAAAELGLSLPAPFYLFPLISGYVGGDLVACLYAEKQLDPVTLYVDIGTNGEMALLTERGWLVTSVPAGPAFEGGGLECGMMAQEGAVAGVEAAGERLRLQVIGGGAPRGLCGSGVVSAISAGLETGLIGRDGTIADPLSIETNLARHVVSTPKGPALRLYRDASVDLLLHQDEIRNFQLAKGALRAGILCLLERAGIDSGEVAEVVLTGAFGLSLRPEELKRVAIFPEKMVDKIRFVEGGALLGCRRFLVDPDGPEKVRRLAQELKPYPLSGTPVFEKSFLNSLDF